MIDTNKSTNVFSFAGRNYTSEQFDVITGIFIVEDTLKYTGISLDVFLFMDSTQQAGIVDVAKRAAHKATPDVNKTMDDIQKMVLMMKQNHISEFVDVLKHDPQGNEVIKNEKPFTSAGRMFHEFLKPKQPDTQSSTQNNVTIGEEEYSVEEFRALVAEFHKLCIYTSLGITFGDFARMKKITQKIIMQTVHESMYKPNIS